MYTHIYIYIHIFVYTHTRIHIHMTTFCDLQPCPARHHFPDRVLCRSKTQPSSMQG